MARATAYARSQEFTDGKKVVESVSGTNEVSLQSEFDQIEASAGDIPAIHDAANPLDLTHSLRADGDQDANKRDLTGWEQVGDGVFNVTGFGAVGDGSTDDTARIQSAIDICATAGGGIVYFPPTSSYYKTTDTLTLSGDLNVHLMGAGAPPTGSEVGSRIKLVVADAKEVISIEGDSDSIKISGLALEQDATVTGSPVVQVIGTSSRVTLDGVQLLNGKADGILFSTTGTDHILRDLEIVGSADYGIDIGSNSHKVKIIDPLINTSTTGAIRIAANNCQIRGGDITQAGSGTTAVTISGDNNRVLNCYIDFVGSGASFGIDISGDDNLVMGTIVEETGSMTTAFLCSGSAARVRFVGCASLGGPTNDFDTTGTTTNCCALGCIGNGAGSFYGASAGTAHHFNSELFSTGTPTNMNLEY